MSKIKESKIIGLTIIGFIYLLSIVLQAVLFNVLNIENLFLKIFIIDIIATLFIFIFSLIFNNSSIYDPYWSVEPLVILIFIVLHNKINYPVVISFVVVFILWSLRLTINWGISFKNLNVQDWRYTMLKEKTKRLYPLVNLFGVHLFPTLVVYLGLLPAIKFIDINYTNYISYIGVGIMLLGVTLEIISDYDIFEYHKRNKDDRRQILNTGLWKYSRHPNYLGEIVFWYGSFFAMLAVSFSNWYLGVGALLINLMFVFISIPMMERRLKTYKFNYEKYQEETRLLLPFKK